jgi:hypothetical protein
MDAVTAESALFYIISFRIPALRKAPATIYLAELCSKLPSTSPFTRQPPVPHFMALA